MKRLYNSAALAAVCLGMVVGGANAATITGWNTDNVDVGATPAEGVPGVSVVYDRVLPDADAVTNGQISFTPPEAVSPGIKVEAEEYTQGGSDPLTLDGCLMTSNPDATCTSPFQSGKRIKQQMTGLGTVDLVFDIDNDGSDSSYQVFHRLINQTGTSLDGFTIELGFGIGEEFTKATLGDGLSFSSTFRASPAGSGAASTQFPFGLFGDATTNPNFDLDGFFASERTGFDVSLDSFTLASTGIFGPYDDIFGYWLSQEAVPTGAFWDNDGDDTTEALLMAWLNPEGIWESRREVDEDDPTAAVSAASTFWDSYEDMVAGLGLEGALFQDVIEDLANLNVNFAINLTDLGNRSSFTLRTFVHQAPVAPIPLPAGAPLLIGALGLLATLRRRRHLVA